MTERERLVELIHKAELAMWGKPVGDAKSQREFIADYLLNHGIIAPPCKVGDTVYQVGKAFTKCSAEDYTPRHTDDSECEGCCSSCDSVSYDRIFVGTVMRISYTNNGISVKVNWDEKWDSSDYEINTVFLTREEAEAALAERRKA